MLHMKASDGIKSTNTL